MNLVLFFEQCFFFFFFQFLLVFKWIKDIHARVNIIDTFINIEYQFLYFLGLPILFSKSFPVINFSHCNNIVSLLVSVLHFVFQIIQLSNAVAFFLNYHWLFLNNINISFVRLRVNRFFVLNESILKFFQIKYILDQ